MNVVMLIAGAAVIWVAQAAGLARLMSRRGFHPLPWFAVAILLGPALWPLAVIELVSGPPGPVLLRRGSGAQRAIFVAFRDDELADWKEIELQGLLPRGDRLVLARVIKAGGPTFISANAERFLHDTAARLGARNAELQLLHGPFERVVGEIQARGDYDLVVRSDQPSELFDRSSSRQEMRCQRDVTAA